MGTLLALSKLHTVLIVVGVVVLVVALVMKKRQS